MNLINSKYSFAFELLNRNGVAFLSMIALDLKSKKTILVFESKEIAFSQAYSEVVGFLKTCETHSLEEIGFPLVDFLALHVDRYKSNLYGFFLNEKKSTDHNSFVFFKESYVSCFAMEICSCFFRLSDEKLFELEKLAVSGANPDDEFYSEKLEIIGLYRQWRLINS